MMVGALYVLLPIVAWIVLAQQRSSQVALWCIGGLLLGGTLAFAGGNGNQVPDEVARIGTGFVLLVANLLRIQSLRLDLGSPWRAHWMALCALSVLAVCVGIGLGLQNQILRAQFFSAVLAIQLFYLVALAWRIGNLEQSRNARMIAVVYALLGWTLLFRMFALSEVSEFTTLIKEGLSMQLVAIAALLSAVIGHLSYVGLALDRSMRRELQGTAIRVRQEENHRLSEQIAALDRQRNLGELSASLGHELNQPLTAILTSAQVARRSLTGGHPDLHLQEELVDKIITNTKRASQIIDRIRGFIRPSVSHKVPVDLHLVVREVAALVSDEAPPLPDFHPAVGPPATSTRDG